MADDDDDALDVAQKIRLDVLGYLIQLEGCPVIKSIAEFKSLLIDTAAWAETGEWPAAQRPVPKLKKLDGGKGAAQAPSGEPDTASG